jgi:O-antigen/teichoic acid export membrane protein
MNFTKVIRYFSTSPINIHEEYTRTQERYRLAAWSAITSALSKGTSMLVMLISIKLTIPYLGADRFGAWLTIASFAAMLSFLDLGAGNALTNNIACSAAHDDHTKLQKNISGGVGILFIVGLMASILLTISASLLPWEALIKVSSKNIYDEIRSTCILFGSLFGIQLFSNGLQKIFAGLQRAYVANLISAISNAIILIVLFFAAKAEAGIYFLLFITLGGTALLNSTLLIILIKKNLFTLHRIGKAIVHTHKPLLASGGLFFVLQITTMVGWGADSLIISSTLGATQVAIFGVAQKIFQLVSQPLSIMNTPLWGAYADAHTRKDIFFIKKTLILSLSATAIAAIILGLAILMWRNEIINYWTNGGLQIPLALMIAFFLWTCCECLGGAFTMFLNGCAIIKPQIYAAVTLIAISIPAKIFLITNTGTSSMLFGFSAIYISIILVFYFFIFKTKINEQLYPLKT